MTSSNQSGPLNVGPNSPTSEPSAVGTVVLVQEYTLDITVETSVAAFRLPGNSSYVGADVLVKTASDAGTTGTVKITDGSSDIITGFNVKSAAGSLLSLSNGDASIASSALFIDPADDADTNQSIVYEETGTAATVGEFLVRIYYLQGDGGQD